MRLKYYLRGVGIGIVVTTIIFMISISLHKNDTEPQNSAAENDKSTTVSEAEENTQKADAAGTETESADTNKTDLADTQPDASKTDEDNSDEKKPSEDTAKDNTASGQQSSDKETESKKKNTEKKNTEKKNTEKKNTEKVRFEIKGGEYSDTVCQKLKAAGLIDDAKAFNEFLVQKDYDNGILPGIYDIPKDATYEEIAALLTTKVE